MVYKSSKFIKRVGEENEIFDIVLIDEGHLLWTKKNQGYTDKGKSYEFGKDVTQLAQIAKRTKVVAYVFDNEQIVRSNQYIDKEKIKKEN